MKVFDTIGRKKMLSFPTGIAVLVMNSIADIIAVEAVFNISESGMVRKMASELKAVREQYGKGGTDEMQTTNTEKDLP